MGLSREVRFAITTELLPTATRRRRHGDRGGLSLDEKDAEFLVTSRASCRFWVLATHVFAKFPALVNLKTRLLRRATNRATHAA
jgi:hypothetical protein